MHRPRPSALRAVRNAVLGRTGPGPTAARAPRALLALAVVALAVAVAAGAPGGAWAAFPAPVVQALALAVLAVAVWWIVSRRARQGGTERAVWQRLARLCGVGTACGAATAVLRVTGAPAPWSAVVELVCAVLAFLALYGALVRWNRYPTALADPYDLINGVSSVLAGSALGDVGLHLLWAPAASAAWWQLLPPVVAVVVLLVCLGTSLSLPALSGLGADPRLWLVTTGTLLGLTGALASLAGLGRTAPWAHGAAGAGALALALAAVLRERSATPRPADPVASTQGAFGVLVTAVAVLVLELTTGARALATAMAALAAVGTAVRLRINVRDLAHLAVTRRQALTDELTGLANRRALLTELEARCDQQVPLVLALLDLDKFKEVNDGLGHAAGDDLIRLVAHRLKAALPDGAVLARLGGDEFAAVLAAGSAVAGVEQVRALGDGLLEALREPFRLGAMSVHVAVSIGLTTSSAGAQPEAAGGLRDAVDATELLRRADAAMYEAKRSGAGTVVYDLSTHARSAGDLALVEQLRVALGAGELVLHHQPQVDVATGRVVGVEALVRWEHPAHGLLAPGSFLPSAEAHGLMGVLTEQVLAQAVAQLAAWRRDGVHLRMSVNLSASNLLDAAMPQRVAELLHRHQVPAAAIVLEVTETVLISDPARSLAVMAELAELGLGISIDDYGTGYSSLAYLQQLPVTELKLDRSFTSDLLASPRTRAVVASTVDLAHALGLRVVAEGVEDAATLAELALLGCDEAQGFLHSPPLEPTELVRWLGARAASPRPGDDRRGRSLPAPRAVPEPRGGTGAPPLTG